MRVVFWAAACVLAAVVGMGLQRNGGNKYVRTRTQAGCIANYVEVLHPDEKRVIVCCTGAADDLGVCSGGRLSSTKILTSYWAFGIPLLALAVNAACDHLAGGATAARTQARWNRFWLYVAVILIRTGVFYAGFNYVQDLVQREESSDCWYAHLRRKGKCSEHFDFADHITLAVCQYFAVQVFELFCILHEYQDLAIGVGGKGARPRSVVSPARIIPAAAVCAVVSGWALLLVYNTASFFHTRGETAMALILSWVAVGPQMFSLMAGDAMGGVVDGRLASAPSIRGVFLAPLEL